MPVTLEQQRTAQLGSRQAQVSEVGTDLQGFLFLGNLGQFVEFSPSLLFELAEGLHLESPSHKRQTSVLPGVP